MVQDALWNEDEYLRLLDPPLDDLTRTRLSGWWIRPAMRAYAWALGLTPFLSWFGPRHLTGTVLRFGVFAASALGLTLAIVGDKPLIAAFAGAVLLGSVLEAHSAARSRVVVGPFTGLSASESLGSSRIAELLRVELARLGDLFQSVEDQRAVSSGIGPKRALDATLSVDSVASALQAAVSAEAKVSLGPLTIPWRMLIAIPDRLVRPPRISGSLLADRSGLIVTAQQDSLEGLSWRVTPADRNGSAIERGTDAAEDHFPQLEAVSKLLRELALRIFTDLALGRSVRWQASAEFVDGLDRVRACLRAPLDRKVNLRRAEQHFLKTLSEDEDFPHAYYNLGVVYNELFTLAWASGRTVEARNHLRAAEISFERAIQRDPQRWENYFALAQTHFQNRRFALVAELCDRMCELKRRGVVSRAKTSELYASALLATRDADRVADANEHARRAVCWSTLAAIRARLLPNFFSVEDELAAACLQTFGWAQSRYAQGDPALWKRVERIYRRGRWLVKQNAELRVELGLLALGAGELGVALEHLRAAVRSDPSRPLYLGALAAAVARAATVEDSSPLRGEAVNQVTELAGRATESMTRAYYPARDGVACDLFARAADALADEELSVLTRELCEYRDEANRRLAGGGAARVSTERERDGGSIVSAAFLQALPLSSALNGVLDEYGRAIQRAQSLLDALRDEASPEQELQKNRALLQREALKEAERATSLNPLSVLAWMTLGDIYQELADYANAQEAWKNAQTQDPDNPALYGRIGTSKWQLAFQGRTRPSRQQLLEAKDLLEKALLLYETATLEEQIRTRYRLGKLFVALHEFDDALAQFRIVETASHKRPPLVGWVLLGRAYLEAREYGEAEYHFGRVIQYGAMVDADESRHLEDSLLGSDVPNENPALTVGTKVDEQREWPLAIVRAWGYLGRALSYAQRDGDLDEATLLLDSAQKLGESPGLPVEAQTRVLAACDDCRGQIHYKRREYEEAATKLELAVRRHPYSRSYVNLAWSYVRLGQTYTADHESFADQANRCVDHAVSLDPDHETTPEIDAIRVEISKLEP